MEKIKWYEVVVTIVMVEAVIMFLSWKMGVNFHDFGSLVMMIIIGLAAILFIIWVWAMDSIQYH